MSCQTCSGSNGEWTDTDDLADRTHKSSHTPMTVDEATFELMRPGGHVNKSGLHRNKDPDSAKRTSVSASSSTGPISEVVSTNARLVSEIRSKLGVSGATLQLALAEHALSKVENKKQCSEARTSADISKAWKDSITDSYEAVKLRYRQEDVLRDIVRTTERVDLASSEADLAAAILKKDEFVRSNLESDLRSSIVVRKLRNEHIQLQIDSISLDESLRLALIPPIDFDPSISMCQHELCPLFIRRDDSSAGSYNYQIAQVGTIAGVATILCSRLRTQSLCSRLLLPLGAIAVIGAGVHYVRTRIAATAVVDQPRLPALGNVGQHDLTRPDVWVPLSSYSSYSRQFVRMCRSSRFFLFTHGDDSLAVDWATSNGYTHCTDVEIYPHIFDKYARIYSGGVTSSEQLRNITNAICNDVSTKTLSHRRLCQTAMCLHQTLTFQLYLTGLTSGLGRTMAVHTFA